MKFGTFIDLNGNEIRNVILQNLASDPTGLGEGHMYWNSGDNQIKVFNGSTFENLGTSGALLIANDLSDLNSAGTARSNLGLGDSAIKDTGTGSGDVAAGDHTHAQLHTQGTDTGTTSSTFEFDVGGGDSVLVKAVSGAFHVRNPGDTDFADLRCENLIVEGTTTTLNSEEVNIGDSNILLNKDITAAAQNSDGGVSVKRLQSDDTTQEPAVVGWDESGKRWTQTIIPGDGNSVIKYLASRYAENVGDGSATSFNVDHELNTKDVTVSVYKISTGEQWLVDVTTSTVDRVVLAFASAPASAEFRVVVVG